MENQKNIEQSNAKDQGKVLIKIKRIRTNPRQRIRKLLRTFIPLNELKKQGR